MKLNNKGFAISGILYAVMILFLTLVVALLAMISNRKVALDKYKKEVKGELNDKAETYGARVQISPESVYVRINEDEIVNFDFKNNVSGCVNGGSSTEVLNTLCQEDETDITNLVNYKIYDETGNEVIGFYTEPIFSSDSYRVDVAYYTYNEKDANGNYVLDETKTKLKVVKKYLTANIENIFYVRYYVVDNKNTLSKEATRTIVIKKYNNYISVTNNYFKVNKSENLTTYNFLSYADCYSYSNGTLTKNNSLLERALYNSEDKAITDFYQQDGVWYYHADSLSIRVTPEEKLRVRYYTGSLDNPTADINFAYFTVE